MKHSKTISGHRDMQRMIRQELRWSRKGDALSSHHRHYYLEIAKRQGAKPFCMEGLWEALQNKHQLPPQDEFFFAIERGFRAWWSEHYHSQEQITVCDLAERLYAEMHLEGYVNFSRIWSLRIANCIIGYASVLPGLVIN